MENRLDYLLHGLKTNKEIYEKKYNEAASTSADEFVMFSNFTGGNAFTLWDKLYNDDGTDGNNISQDRYFAKDKDLLFQTKDDTDKLTNKISLYDLNKNEMKVLTEKSDVYSQLNTMDSDGKDDTLTDKNGKTVSKTNFLDAAKNYAIKLVNDGFEIIGGNENQQTTTPTNPTTPTTNPTTTKGDPHYDFNGQRSFDHQGTIGEEYLELDSDEMQMISKRGAYDKNATVISDEAIELKGSGLTVVAHSDGKYEVNQLDANGNNNVIMDQSGYKTADAAKTMQNVGASVNMSGKTLTVTYQNRKSVLSIEKGYINDLTSAQSTDTGLKSQSAAVYDQNNEKNLDGTITIDGKQYNYDQNQQDMVAEKGHTSFNLNRLVNGKKVSDLIKNDIAKLDNDGTIDGYVTDADGTRKRISLSQAYSTSSGYSAAEFNELIGELIYSSDSIYF